jgi:hypothetical protein
MKELAETNAGGGVPPPPATVWSEIQVAFVLLSGLSG